MGTALRFRSGGRGQRAGQIEFTIMMCGYRVHRSTFGLHIYRDAFPRVSNGNNSAMKPDAINKEAET
jgi:hypothetical protein